MTMVYRSYGMLLAAFFIFALNGGSLYIFGILLPDIMSDLGTSEVATSWIGSLQFGMTLGSSKLDCFESLTCYV